MFLCYFDLLVFNSVISVILISMRLFKSATIFLNLSICDRFYLRLRLALGLIEVQRENFVYSYWDCDRLLPLLRSDVKNLSNRIEIEMCFWPC